MAIIQRNTMDMTRGNPMRTIMVFAVPFFVGNVFQMFYNTVDTMVVGRFVGSQALASVGGAGISYNVMLMLINGFMNGASVVVAQAFGSRDYEAVRKGYATSCIMIAVSGIIFTVLGELLALPLLRILKTPEDVIDGSLLYLRVMYIGILATGLYNGLAAFLRAVGDSITPLVALVISSCINVVLDLVFVLALKQGIAGVALATIISQAVSGLYCRQRMHKRIRELLPSKGEFRFDRKSAGEMVRIGVPAAFSSAVVTFSVMLIQRAVNHCPLTPATAGIINEKSISKMKDGVIIVNLSRGPVVNEIELADALRKGKVAAFGADVISEEPMKADNPLYTAPNCYLTPHIAWATREARERLVDIAAANIKAFLEGKPINVVSG